MFFSKNAHPARGVQIYGNPVSLYAAMTEDLAPLCAMKAHANKPHESNDRALESGCYTFIFLVRKVTRSFLACVLRNGRKQTGQWTLQSVFCNDVNYIQFKPNGGFISAEWSSVHDLDDKADHKDSKSITVGRCGVM
jgi:hypothetical protein